jgi:hypothetical protein
LLDGLVTAGHVQQAASKTGVVQEAGENCGDVIPGDLAPEWCRVDPHATRAGIVGQTSGPDDGPIRSLCCTASSAPAFARR